MRQFTEKIFETQEGAYRIPQTATRVSMIAATMTLVIVASLHILKPDQNPSWHMVSEYAIGDFGWLMQVGFFCWALSCLTLAATVRAQAETTGGRIGVALLFLVGIAIIMAGSFVIDSPTVAKDQVTTHGQLHGLASMIGVPGQPVAAALISKSLTRKYSWREEKRRILTMAHFTWVSLLVMFGSIALMMVTNEGKFGPGVVIGWANRIYIVACCAWLISITRLGVRPGNKISPVRST